MDVFEPSAENLKYLRENISLLPSELSKTVSIIKKGVGNENTFLNFYIDPITGQNNSFVKDFDGFYENRKLSADRNAELLTVSVPVIKLDDYLSSNAKFPNFIKIDVEGFEYNVILGARRTVEKYRPNFMIEVQRDENDLISFFLLMEYRIYNVSWVEILNWNDYLNVKTPNLFFISTRSI